MTKDEAKRWLPIIHHPLIEYNPPWLARFDTPEEAKAYCEEKKLKKIVHVREIL